MPRSRFLFGFLTAFLLFQAFGSSYLGDSETVRLTAGVHLVPADSTTYFIGMNPGQPTAAPLALYRVPIFSPGFVRKLGIAIIPGTTYEGVPGVAGSAETGSIYLRVNDTTDYLLDSNVNWAGFYALTYFGDPNNPIALNDGDFIEIKIVTPAWITNPTNVLYHGAMRLAP